MKTYRHPETKDIKTVKDNDVQEAALKKLGYVVVTAADIANEAGLTVDYRTVAQATVPTTPPALPHLSVPVPPGPTRDPDAPAQTTPATPGITGSPQGQDVQSLTGNKK